VSADGAERVGADRTWEERRQELRQRRIEQARSVRSPETEREARADGMKWDIFISYASEDREFVQQLAEALEYWGLTVWLDQSTLQPGDSLRRGIDEGLAQSRYGVVVLSSAFFAKDWTQRELDGLIARETNSRKVIIPVWHNVTADEIRRFSPTMADRISIFSTGHVDAVTEKIIPDFSDT